MAIQHSTITGSNVHESKGVDTAEAKRVYVTNGAGSGTWKKVGADNLLGVTTDGGVAGLKPVTDGAEGFTLIADAAYGSMVINNNATATASLTAATDATLAATAGYTIITGTGAPWASENLHKVTFNTDRLTVSVTGLYAIEATIVINKFPTGTAKVGIRTRVNGTTYGTRRSTLKSIDAGEHGTFTLREHIQLTAGQYVQIAVATSAAGTLIYNDATVNLRLIRQTA